MKKKSISNSLKSQAFLFILILIGLLLSQYPVFGQTQEFFGAGAYGVFGISEDGTKARVLKGFDEGIHPTSRYLTFAQDKLWGITTEDGFSGHGTIFTVNLDGTGYHDVYHFYADINSDCKLLYYDGKLWGTTHNGGASEIGSIFSLDLISFKYEQHFEFSDFQALKYGRYPGSLIQLGDQLWGVTSSGGEYMKGTIFRYHLDGTGFEKVHDFQVGEQPAPGLTYDGERLWGVTKLGGDNGLGTLFSISENGDEFEIIHHFDPVDGGNAEGELTNVDGVIYGSTMLGGVHDLGTIFTVDPIAGFSKIYDFSEASGGNPVNKLIWADTVFVGMTTSGLNEDLGGLFAFNPELETLRVLEEFDVLDDFRSGLTLVGNDLWGTTYQEGEHAQGSIFTYTLETNINKTVFEFGNHIGDNTALSQLVLYNDRLWGTVMLGGANGFGVIYSITTTGEDFQMHHHFVINEGNPLYRLTRVGSEIWGVLIGAGQYGAIYSFDMDSEIFTIEHSLTQEDGNSPSSGLTESEGYLWGVTDVGGEHNLGVVYKLDPDNPTDLTVVHEFSGSDGQYPYGTMTEYEGKLYGTTRLGGDFNSGTLFSIDLVTGQMTIEYHFMAEESADANGRMTVYRGRLWGSSHRGGLHGAGSIFAFDTESGNLEVIHEFSAVDGAAPSGGLVELNGNLYGTTYVDGEYYSGVFFVITDGGTDFIKLRDFNIHTGGAMLEGGLIMADAGFDENELVWNGNEWLEGNVPQVNDDVRIEGDFRLHEEGMSIHSLRIQPGATLTVESDFTLEVLGHLINNGRLIVESGGSLITYEGNMHGGSPVEVKKSTRFDDGRYSFVGSPVKQSSEITGSLLGTQVYTYDESLAEEEQALNRWVNAASEVLQPGRGYTQAFQENLSFSGIPNDGTITYAAGYVNDGWHLVSNPYAAAIDINLFLDANANTTGAIYIWDDNGSDEGRGSNSDYVVANRVGATDLNGENNENRWNGHVSSTQGFFVKLDGSAGDITFTEDMRVVGENADDHFYRMDQDALPLIRLNLSSRNGTQLSQAILAWNPDISGDEMTKGYDAPVFQETAPNLIYMPKYGEKLAIHTANPKYQSVSVGYNTADLDTYVLSISEDSKRDHYYLKDHITGEVVSFSEHKPYVFESKKGAHPDRFELIISDNTPTGALDKSLEVIVYDKQVRVSNSTQTQTLKIVDLTGHPIKEYPNVSNDILDLSAVADGIYLLIYGDFVKKVSLQ